MARESRRLAIRAEIARQRQAGLNPSVRSIRAITGGSDSTIAQELKGEAQPEQKKATRGATPLDLTALAEVIDGAIGAAINGQIIALTSGITKSIDQSNAYSMQKIEHAYMRLMEMAEVLKHTSAQLLLAPPVKPPSAQTAPDVNVDIQRANAKIQALINDNAQMTRKLQHLVSLCTDHGIEVDLQQLGK